MGLYATSLGFHLWAAQRLGVASGEAPRLKAALDVGQLIEKARAAGFGSISRPLIEQAFAAGKPSPMVPTLLEGLSWQLLADHDGKRWMRSLRFAWARSWSRRRHRRWCSCSARRPLGTAMAIAAALFALFLPRGIEAGAVLSGDGVLSALLLASVVAYVRARRRSAHAYLHGVLAAVFLGLAISVSFAALLVVPVLAIHGAITSPRAAERLLPRGEFPLAGAIAWLPIAGGAAFFASQPYLWSETFDRTRDLLIQAGAPHLGPGLWASNPPTVDALPRAHALTMVFASLPSLTAALAVVGASVALLRVGKGDRLSPALALSLSLASAFVGWPFLCPQALATFPSHFALALPYVAVLAAFGTGVVIDALQRRFQEFRSRGFGEGLAIAALLPALFSCLSPVTSSASFPFLAGGSKRAATSHIVPLHDATPLGGLTKMIDLVAHEGSSIYAPDVPTDVLEWSQRLGRIHAHLRPATSPVGADLLLLTGNVDASFTRGAKVTESVRREGQDILTLVVR